MQISDPPRDETDYLSNHGRPAQFLSHAARHEATDRDLIVKSHRPNHPASRPVRFGYDGVVGNIDPLILNADPLMAVFGFPIWGCDAFTIRHRAAQSLAAVDVTD